MARFYDDPLGFVLFAYEWDKGELKGFHGPDEWQRNYLIRLGEEIKKQNFDGVNPAPPIQKATTSGHGIGKSALTAWLCNFLMSTRPFCRGVVTANTSPQLRTKTWAEIQKWTKRCITGHWFDVTSGQQMAMKHKDHPESWFISAQTCAKENSESFAGLHAANSTPFYIFDEASAIDNAIWEVAEGGLTDGAPMWFVFGNPTRSSGAFFEAFNLQEHRWITTRVDSRRSSLTNKDKIQQWIDDFGEDSDFVRVRVKGEFPRSGSCQFISTEDVQRCIQEYKSTGHHDLPIVIGVDVARFGDDQSIIATKQGRKTWPLQKFRGLDTMELAHKVAETMDLYNPDGTFIDGGGVGGGVIDRLKQLNYKVTEVQFGGKPNDSNKYKNKRAEMWGDMRDAIAQGIDLPEDIKLKSALTAVEYGYNDKDQIQLEKKEDMKKRGLASPDEADALALTFAFKIPDRSQKYSRYNSNQQQKVQDYDPFG